MWALTNILQSYKKCQHFWCQQESLLIQLRLKKAALLPKYQALKVYKWCGIKYPHVLALNTRW
jgi:hypothetical protein